MRKHIPLLITLLLAGSSMLGQSSPAEQSALVDASVQAGVDANVSSLGTAVPADAISASDWSSTSPGISNAGMVNLADAQKQKWAALTGNVSVEQKQKLTSAAGQSGFGQTQSKQQQVSKNALGNTPDSQKTSKGTNAAKLQSLQASTMVPKLKSQNASRQNPEADDSASAGGSPKADSTSIFSLDSGPSVYAAFDPGSRIGLGDSTLDFNPVTSHTSNSRKSDQLGAGRTSDGRVSQASATDSDNRSGDDNARRVRKLKASDERRSHESLHPKSAKQRREDERHSACPSCTS